MAIVELGIPGVGTQEAAVQDLQNNNQVVIRGFCNKIKTGELNLGVEVGPSSKLSSANQANDMASLTGINPPPEAIEIYKQIRPLPPWAVPKIEEHSFILYSDQRLFSAILGEIDSALQKKFESNYPTIFPPDQQF